MNNLEILRTMPDESVQCCVTSPPYWGLRDYGTATWVGGDTDCDHKSGRFERGGLSAKQASNNGSGGDEALGECPKCGATRIDRQLGLERTPEEYVAKMVEGFREVRRVLRKDGTLWLNLGDSYAARQRQSGAEHAGSLTRSSKGVIVKGVRDLPPTLKEKDLVGIPWMVAFALRSDGWYLRQDIIWSKPNPMPESVTDRCTKAHEYLFLLSKSERYYCDMEAVKEPCTADHLAGNNSHKGLTAYEEGDERHRTKAGLVAFAERSRRDSFKRENSKRAEVFPGQSVGTHRPERAESAWDITTRNKRSVWEIATSPFPEAHFATFPPKLVEPCILAGTSEKGCCPKCGAPWERVTEKNVRFESGSGKAGNPPTGKNGDEYEQAVSGDYDIRMGRPVTETRTIGWQPTCTCNAGEPVPCTVLDPFNGAGTTGLVATRLGRDYLGIDLSPNYCEMARNRIKSDAPLFNMIEETA